MTPNATLHGKKGFDPSHHRQLGSTDLLVSPLALGTVKLGRNTQVKYPAAFELPDDKQATALLDTAAALGINLVDTAPAYGDSEARLGRLLPGKRTDWVICTKAGEFFEGGQSRYDYSAEAVTASVIESLRLLDTDYLDMVLVHSDGNDEAILDETDVLETLFRFKDAGEVRTVGFSAKTPTGALSALPLVDVLMLPLDPGDTSHLPVIEAAGEQGCGVLLKKIFASGHHPDPADCIRFTLGAKGVSAAVVGTINPNHLAANVQAALGCLQG